MQSDSRDVTTNLATLQALLALSFDLFCLWSADGYWQRFNPAWEAVLGWSEEGLRKPWVELIHPEDLAVGLAALEYSRQNQRGEFELRCRHQDGSYRWLVWRIFWVSSEYAYATAKDITEQRQGETRYQMLSTLTSDYVYSAKITQEGKVVTQWVTEAFERISGYTLTELETNGGWWRLIHSEDHRTMIDQCQKVMNNQPVLSKYRIVTKSGQIRWLQDYAHPEWDTVEQRVVGVFGATRDITEQQQVELALRESEERWQLVLHANNDGIWDWNLETNEVFYSGRCQEMLGYGAGEIENHFDPQTSRIHPEDLNRVMRALEDYCEKKTPYYKVEYRLRCQDGRYKWILSRAQAVWNNAGDAIRLVGSHTDITERKEAETALRQQVQKERLIGRMTQCIRQSLNLETILNTTVAEVRQFLNVDRVVIYRFEADWSGRVAVESVDEESIPLLGRVLPKSSFLDSCIAHYQRGHIYAFEDIETVELSPYHRDLLHQLQVRGLLVVPILQSTRTSTLENACSLEENLLYPSELWGLLVAHQCKTSRQWQPLEIELLSSLANQLAIAIEQAELYQQLAAANQELQRLATCDCLTQVANRRRFDEYFEQEWCRGVRQREPLSLLLCDVDFFKAFNDRYGHQAGDQCLRVVAEAIQQTLKRPADLVARYGGEEFVVILPNTNFQGALYVAESICQAVKQFAIPHAVSTVSEVVTLSIGVATQIPSVDHESAGLITAADAALYQAKANGRDQCVGWNTGYLWVELEEKVS